MSDLIKTACELASQIEKASSDKRLDLQPALELILRRMQEGGMTVPPALRNLEEELTAEVIEARFDNVPL